MADTPGSRSRRKSLGTGTPRRGAPPASPVVSAPLRPPLPLDRGTGVCRLSPRQLHALGARYGDALHVDLLGDTGYLCTAAPWGGRCGTSDEAGGGDVAVAADLSMECTPPAPGSGAATDLGGESSPSATATAAVSSARLPLAIASPEPASGAAGSAAPDDPSFDVSALRAALSESEGCPSTAGAAASACPRVRLCRAVGGANAAGGGGPPAAEDLWLDVAAVRDGGGGGAGSLGGSTALLRLRVCNALLGCGPRPWSQPHSSPLRPTPRPTPRPSPVPKPSGPSLLAPSPLPPTPQAVGAARLPTHSAGGGGLPLPLGAARRPCRCSRRPRHGGDGGARAAAFRRRKRRMRGVDGTLRRPEAMARWLATTDNHSSTARV